MPEATGLTLTVSRNRSSEAHELQSDSSTYTEKIVISPVQSNSLRERLHLKIKL